MKKLSMVLAVATLMLAPAGGAVASVSLYLDSAPNVYGSPDWAPWWAAAKPDVVAGTFTNLRTGTFAGTNWIHPYDEIVYSTGDLGKRLHWIYWVPGETKASLDGKFEVRFVIDWDGVEYTYDWGDGGFVEPAPDKGWIQPGSWEDYDDGTNTGVIGSFGHAWWAVDDDALPYDTGGSPYDETDQADIDALRDSVFASQTFARGEVRIQGADWEYYSLQADVIPEPASVIVWSLLIGITWAGGAWRHFYRRRRQA